MKKFAVLKISVSKFPERAPSGAAIVTSASKMICVFDEKEKRGSKIAGVGASYWRPDTEIDYESFRRNGISPVDVGMEPDAEGNLKETVPFKKGVEEADSFMEDVLESDYIVAHGADYVKSVLESSGYDVSGKTFIDTLNVARNMYMFERNSLDAVVLDFRLYAYENAIERFLREKGIEDHKLLTQSVATGYIKRFVDETLREFGVDLQSLAERSEDMKFVPFGDHKGKPFEELSQKELSEVFFSLKEDVGSLPEKIRRIVKEKGYVLKPYFKTGADAGKHIGDPSVKEDKVKFLAEKSGNPLVRKYAKEELEKRAVIKKFKLVGSKKERAHAMQNAEEVMNEFGNAGGEGMPGG